MAVLEYVQQGWAASHHAAVDERQRNGELSCLLISYWFGSREDRLCAELHPKARTHRVESQHLYSR